LYAREGQHPKRKLAVSIIPTDSADLVNWKFAEKFLQKPRPADSEHPPVGDASLRHVLGPAGKIAFFSRAQATGIWAWEIDQPHGRDPQGIRPKE
jgi:hypothetical protein